MADGDSGYKIHVEAAQKFDYFVTGAAGAALSYVVQSYNRKASDPWWWLVDAAMLMLLVAFGWGLLYLNSAVENLRINAAIDRAAETLTTLRKAKGVFAPVYIPGVDLVVPPGNIPEAIEMGVREMEGMRDALQPLAVRQNRAQATRNWAIVGGLAVLTIWKILQH